MVGAEPITWFTVHGRVDAHMAPWAVAVGAVALGATSVEYLVQGGIRSSLMQNAADCCDTRLRGVVMETRI